MYLRGEMKSERNITPLSGSTSTATGLILIHENAHPCPVNHFDALIDLRPSHSTGTPSYG